MRRARRLAHDAPPIHKGGGHHVLEQIERVGVILGDLNGRAQQLGRPKAAELLPVAIERHKVGASERDGRLGRPRLDHA